MKLWLTAAEIAGLALPQLPSSKRGVLDLAAREGWAARAGLTRQSRRGATQYHLDLLPPEARAAVAAQALGRVAVPEGLVKAAAAEPEAERLNAPAAEHRDARLAILAAIDTFRAAGGLSAVSADALFVGRYNLGKVPVDPWIREALPTLAPRSIARWRAMVRAGTIHRLAVDPGAKRRGKGVLEREDIRVFVLGCIARQPHLSADHIRTAVADRFPALDLPQPRTFRHQIKAWREAYKVELTQITNPDKFKSSYRTSGTHSHQVSRLNELWMIDASPADVLTKDGRYAVYVCLDIYSRRIQVYVTKTPRAEAVCLLMRRAILAWGICERVKTDNGSDFRARRTTRLMASLGIEVEVSAAFSPWQKGHVERAIRTLQHDGMAVLPGFLGHNVADRKVIEERKAFAARLGESDDNVFCVDLTPAELQGHCDRWAEGRYAARPHDGLAGVTPQQAAAGYVGPRRDVDPHALDILLAPIAGGDGIRTVSKRGVQVKGSHYLTPTVLPDTRVLVRMDPADMGRAWLFDPEAETYLGEAVCPELAGIDPAEFVAVTRAAHAKILKEGTAAIRAEMRSKTPLDIARMIERQGAIAAGKLVEFPRASVAHTTPAIEAAGVAAQAERPEPARPEPARSEPAEDIAPNVHVLRTVETPQQRFRRALTLEAAIKGGEPVDPMDAVWLGGYAAGSEYRAMTAAYEDFGEAALC